MNKPLISIISINYNNLEGLKRTIRSVLNQSYQEFEYIIIDGGSTDGSVEYIESETSNIDYWVSEPDSGIYNAMNKGIEVAKGEYFLFLNSGDFLTSKSALHDFVSHKDFYGDIIYGDYKFETGEKIFPDKLTPYFFIKTSLPHQATFFKKKIFEEMGSYNEKFILCADREFYIRCFLNNNYIFKHIEYPLAVFDLLGVSNNPANINQRTVEHELMFSEHYGIFYTDYKHLLNLQKEIREEKKKTIKGISKRIVKKIKNICRFH